MTLHRRAKTLFLDSEISIRLSWYEAGEILPEHSHDLGQVSVLLSGGFREISDARAIDNNSAFIGYKPSGLDHANLYGETGALILSVNFSERDLPYAGRWNWFAARKDQIALTRQIVAGGLDDAIIRAAALDLVESTLSDETMEAAPAAWAIQLREQLHDETGVDLDAAARQFGIHRAHLSRGFRRWFGMPPSLYALRCRMSRAVRDLADGQPAVQAAAAAGFSDQSHMIRTLKRETGLTPAHLTRLLAA